MTDYKLAVHMFNGQNYYVLDGATDQNHPGIEVSDVARKHLEEVHIQDSRAQNIASAFWRLATQTVG
jgi:hypothetical protein